jgi:hypothetical protein
MDQILSAIGDSVNTFLNNQNVQLAGRAVAIYVVLLWLAAAYWAYRDLQSRTSNPVAPYLAAIIIILFTPILFLFGLLLYRLVRPGETVAEANERAIAEEAMLREIEAQPHCANCNRRVDADWLICPTCRNQLRRMCPSCGKKVELDWAVCAWCATELIRPVPAARPVARRGSRPAPRTATGSQPAGAPSASEGLGASITSGFEPLRAESLRADQGPAGGSPGR